MNMTQMTAIAIGLAVVSAGALRAQTQETKTTTKTKVEMKGGKDVTIVGCLERRDNGDYVLTNIRDVRGMDPTQYALVTDDDAILAFLDQASGKLKVRPGPSLS
jgi:hypothetical protein